MKKLFVLLLLSSSLFADTLTLENQTSYPTKKSKMAVQWASSAREIEDINQAMIYGLTLNANTFKTLSQLGKTTLNIPKLAQYFRVLVWSQGQKEPDLLTNWVEIVPDKTYTLEADHLIPAVLLCGSGC